MIKMYDIEDRLGLRCHWAATTTAIIMAGVAAAGAATSAYSSYASGQAQKAASDYNSKVAENNAIAQEQQGMAAAKQVSEKNRRLRGSQIAAFSAAGVDSSGGSAGDVEYDSAVQGELTRLTTLYKAKVGASSSAAQAQLDRFTGRSAQTSGYLGAAGSLLSGAGSAIYDYSMVNGNPSFAGGGGASGD